MVDKISPIPLYIQIQDRLYEQIRSGELSAGARVPSEPELAAEYDVSRMTARKALDRLANKGYIFRRQGKGTFVSDGILSYDLSTMLSFSRTLRVRGYEVSTRVLHQDVIPASLAVAESLKLRPGSEVVLIHRLRNIDRKPAAIHTSFLDYRIFAPIVQLDLSTTSLLEAIEQVSGRRIAYTKDSVQATLVDTEDMDLLEIPAGSPVLEVEGVAFTENGQPIRLTKAIYRGDLFKLVVTNSGDQSTSLKMTNSPIGLEPA